MCNMCCLAKPPCDKDDSIGNRFTDIFCFINLFLVAQ